MESTPFQPLARVQLFCFPHAGASAGVYARWKQRLPPWIHVRPTEYPGHGQRLREPLQGTVSGLVQDLAVGLAADVRRPFAFFGHSLGALVAFELAYVLWRRLEVQPLLLFASGSAAPAMRDDARYTRLRSDEDVLAELRRQGGTPAAALDDPEILELTLPIVRADLESCGKYRYVERPPLKCAIHAFGGREDEGVPHERLAAWGHHTRGEFTLDLLPGGHFFTQQSENALLQSIEARLAPLLVPRDPDLRASCEGCG